MHLPPGAGEAVGDDAGEADKALKGVDEGRAASVGAPVGGNGADGVHGGQTLLEQNGNDYWS